MAQVHETRKQKRKSHGMPHRHALHATIIDGAKLYPAGGRSNVLNCNVIYSSEQGVIFIFSVLNYRQFNATFFKCR